MTYRKKLVLEAAMRALQVRQSLHLGLFDPICVYDVAEEMGVEVRFVDLPSLEGMYCRHPGPLVLISSLRPPGRQVFSCGHELGHHVFGHSTHIDQYSANPGQKKRFEPDEFVADCFSGFLLMPKTGVSRAFAIRGWRPTSSTATDFYTVAGWFGVGYTTLIQHMCHTLNLQSESRAYELQKVTPKRIRSVILDEESSQNLIVVDEHWTSRPVDVQVGDLILVPVGTRHEGCCVEPVRQNGNHMLYHGITPGIGRFYHPDTGWSAYVRVSRQDYTGRSLFRHLEDPDDTGARPDC